MEELYRTVLLRADLVRGRQHIYCTETGPECHMLHTGTCFQLPSVSKRLKQLFQERLEEGLLGTGGPLGFLQSSREGVNQHRAAAAPMAGGAWESTVGEISQKGQCQQGLSLFSHAILRGTGRKSRRAKLESRKLTAWHRSVAWELVMVLEPWLCI